MSKKEHLKNLANFIGLRAAHDILIRLTNRQESVPHLEQEADTYTDLGLDLAMGNWNKEDIGKIKELAGKKCNKKLGKYKEIGREKYRETGKVISGIMNDLELV